MSRTAELLAREPAVVRSALVGLVTSTVAVVALVTGSDIDAGPITALVTALVMAGSVIAGLMIRPAVTPETTAAGLRDEAARAEALDAEVENLRAHVESYAAAAADRAP